MTNNLLLITLLMPFAGAGLILLLPGQNYRAIRWTAILTALFTLAGTMALYHGFTNGKGLQYDTLIRWVPSFGITLHFGLDGLSLPLVLMSAVVGLAAMLMAEQPERSKSFYLLLTLVLGSSLAAFASLNLFFFYFFCEVTTIPKFLLTAVWGHLPGNKYKVTKEYAAMQVTLYIAAGAMLVLLAIALLYFVGGGQMDFNSLRMYLDVHPINVATQRWIFGLLLLGFGIWSSMWPFHTWSPLTYAVMPSPAAMLFAGVAKNFGAYALLRIGTQLLPEGARTWAEPLAIIATINILYGGWAAMRQKDWNFIIGYSSVSHVGYLLLALAVVLKHGSASAQTAVIFFMFAHGLIVALLFALSGSLEKMSGRRFVPDLGGLARATPFLASAFAIAVIGASGLPGFANFVAELLVFLTSWATGGAVFRIAAIAAVWGVVMTATYLFRALRSTFYGEPRGIPQQTSAPGLAQRIAIVILIAFSALAGFWPRVITDKLEPASSVAQTNDFAQIP